MAEGIDYISFEIEFNPGGTVRHIANIKSQQIYIFILQIFPK